MDLPGFEPGAFRMQSERDTTTLQTRYISSTHKELLEEVLGVGVAGVDIK